MLKDELIQFETRLKDSWEQGEVRCPLHLSGGNENQLIHIFKAVHNDDYVFSTHRNHYHALLHGVCPEALHKEIFGLANGLCKGRARSMCTMDQSRRFYASAIVGGVCGIAVGVAWTLKQKKSPQRVWAFIGDGAVDTGHFWEAYRYALEQDLPIIFVIEDNDRSTCTSITERWGNNTVRKLNGLDKVIYYAYKPKYPHVGSGTYVQF